MMRLLSFKVWNYSVSLDFRSLLRMMKIYLTWDERIKSFSWLVAEVGESSIIYILTKNQSPSTVGTHF